MEQIRIMIKFTSSIIKKYITHKQLTYLDTQPYIIISESNVYQILLRILESNQIKSPTEKFSLFHPPSGAFLENNKTLYSSGVKDGDILELRESKKCIPLNFSYLSLGIPLNENSIKKYMKIIMVDKTEPLTKVLPYILNIFQIKEKCDLTFSKLTIKNGSLEVNNYININLSPKEQKINYGILIEPITVLTTKTLYEVTAISNQIKKYGWMTKNSQKGQGRVTPIKKRWCILQKQFLFYFSNNKGSSKPCGVIDCEFMNVKKEGKTIILQTSEFSLKDKKCYYNFTAENEKEAEEWFGYIRYYATNGDPRREFGISLEKLMKQSSKPFRIFCIIINYLDNNALDIPNIFHDYGDNSLINIIKKKLDEGRVTDLDEFRDPISVSSLLKIYLKELPEPLLTFSLYDKFISFEDIEQLKEIILSLPLSHQLILEILLFFLGRVLDHSQKNGMDIKLLAYTFGPIILQKKEQNTSYMEDILKIHKVTQFLIENRFKLIFKKPKGKINCRGYTVQALYDYTSSGKLNSRGEIELSFNKSDIIKVIEERSNSSWLKVEINHKIGLIPSNYVIKIDHPKKVHIRLKKKKKLSKEKKDKNINEKLHNTLNNPTLMIET